MHYVGVLNRKKRKQRIKEEKKEKNCARMKTQSHKSESTNSKTLIQRNGEGTA